MKLAFIFALVALCFALAWAEECNPDGNGKPACTVDQVGQNYRNNWDPTKYWLCTAVGVAELESCDGKGYDPISDSCVDWSLWVYYPPCP